MHAQSDSDASSSRRYASHYRFDKDSEGTLVDDIPVKMTNGVNNNRQHDGFTTLVSC